MNEGDTVGYIIEAKREAFGDMTVQKRLSNNRVQVISVGEDGIPQVWDEYESDLFIVRKADHD